ncbi:MAG: spermidine synthase, partial [Planctomycetota bacterium]
MAESPEKEGATAERVEAAALYAVVFVCGTVLMAAEIAGSRVLAPHFGSAIFVWGSLIGVVMAALAIGYYVGGRVADKKPSFPLLCGIVAGAGLWLLVMPAFSNAVCGGIEIAFDGPRAGPLLASVVLYIVPGVLLAMVSPFAVRLSARELTHIGNVAGRLYALSTIGSIVGTIGTAFVLIPYMGTRKLVFSLGVALLLTAAVGMAVVWREARKGLKTAAGILLAAGLIGPVVALGLDEPGARLSRPWEVRWGIEHKLIDWSDSAYHLILVIVQPEYKEPETGKTRARRVLRFNDRIQSAIYIDTAEGDAKAGTERLKSFESAVGYTDLLHLGLIFCPEARKALVVGCGGGIAPTELARDYGMDVDIAEVDPEVERIARKYFHVGMDARERVKFHIGDGRRTLKRLEGGYDLIVLDAYSSGGHIPAHLTTREFLELCLSKLSPR